ncbi:MAG: 3'-5' exonuclease [Persephonella sp.]|nr:3'-5' exonuclease [Persephonella sp.]
MFPSGKAFEDIEQMEEERRLFYVAITRAKEKVFITYARKRATFSGHLNETKPSRFLKDIKDKVKTLSDRKDLSEKAAVYQHRARKS